MSTTNAGYSQVGSDGVLSMRKLVTPQLCRVAIQKTVMTKYPIKVMSLSVGSSVEVGRTAMRFAPSKRRGLVCCIVSHIQVQRANGPQRIQCTEPSSRHSFRSAPMANSLWWTLAQCPQPLWWWCTPHSGPTSSPSICSQVWNTVSCGVTTSCRLRVWNT